jgi:hypothetical protein
MAETSFFWDGIITGDHGPYNDAQFSTLISSIFQSHRTTQSVLKGSMGELVVTNPTGLTIRMASGKALIDGKPYTNTANKDFVLGTPNAGKHYYTLVLRKDFSAQTVRAIMLGPDIFAPPVVNQSDGCVWEVSIATIAVSSNEVVTITDTREFCAVPMQLTTGRIVDANITHEKIADATVEHTRLSAGLFPYTTVGDIAHLSATPGVLSAVSPTGIGDVLVSGGVGATPIFRANFAGAGISSTTLEAVPAESTIAPELSITDWDEGYWGTFVSGTNSLIVPSGAEGLYLVNGMIGWGLGATEDMILEIVITGAGTYPSVRDYEKLGDTISVDFIWQTVSALVYLQDLVEVNLNVYNGNPMSAVDLVAKYLSIARLG